MYENTNIVNESKNYEKEIPSSTNNFSTTPDFTKEVLFFGASNTFGCGLQVFTQKYFSIEEAKKVDQIVIANSSSEEEMKFLLEHRWTSMIAKSLGRKEINLSECGGSPAESLHILQQRDLSNADYIFFEFSSVFSFYDRYIWHRGIKDVPRTPGEIEKFLTNGKHDRPELRERIKQWVIEFNPIEFIDETMINLAKEVETLRKDKKIVVIWWRPYHYDGVTFEMERYPFLKPYSVKFPYSSNENNYSAHVMINALNLTVSKEHPYGKYFAHPDDHAGVKGNKLVYKCIMNHINEKGTSNSW